MALNLIGTSVVSFNFFFFLPQTDDDITTFDITHDDITATRRAREQEREGERLKIEDSSSTVYLISYRFNITYIIYQNGRSGQRRSVCSFWLVIIIIMWTSAELRILFFLHQAASLSLLGTPRSSRRRRMRRTRLSKRSRGLVSTQLDV